MKYLAFSLESAYMFGPLAGQIFISLSREDFYRRTLEYLQPVLCNIRCNFVFSPPLVKSLCNSGKIEDLSSVNRRFASRDSAGAIKNNWPCHPLPLVVEGSTMPNIHALNRYCERHSWMKYLRALNVNQPLTIPSIQRLRITQRCRHFTLAFCLVHQCIADFVVEK